MGVQSYDRNIRCQQYSCIHCICDWALNVTCLHSLSSGQPQLPSWYLFLGRHSLEVSMNCWTLSQCWAHQNHQNWVILPLCTSHQHAQSQFIGEHVVSQGLLLNFKGTWPSSTLSMKRRKGNTSKLSVKTNMGRHSFSLCVTLYKQLQQEPHHTASKKEQDINCSY